jgi:hypothetical protein
VPPRRGCLRRRWSLPLCEKLVGLFHDCSTLPHNYISGVFNR